MRFRSNGFFMHFSNRPLPHMLPGEGTLPLSADTSILPPGQILSRGFGGEYAFGRNHAYRQVFPAYIILDRLHDLRAQERIAFHGAAQLSFDHRLKGAMGRVDGDYDDVLPRPETGLLHGLDRADRHVVVMREKSVDLPVLPRQDPLHDLVALVLEEIPAFRGDYLIVRIVLYHFLEADSPVYSWSGADRALELDDVDGAHGLRVLDE